MARRADSPAPAITQGPDFWRREAARYAATEMRSLPAIFHTDPSFPEVFTLQMARESIGFRADVVSGKTRSPAGAWGIAQIMAISHPTAPPGNKPHAQLAWAADYMADRVKQYYFPGKNPQAAKMSAYRDALSVYNSGQPWARGKLIRETRDYVAAILGPNAATRIGGIEPKDSILDWGKDRLEAVQSPLELFGKLAGNLTERQFWTRAAGVVIGGFLLVWAITLIARELGAPSPLGFLRKPAPKIPVPVPPVPKPEGE